MASTLENTIRKTVTQGVNALHRFNSGRGAATELHTQTQATDH